MKSILSATLQSIPDLSIVIKKLSDNNIKYGLYAGAYVSLITSNRVPTDVDFVVADEDFDKLKVLFPHAQLKGDEKNAGGLFLYPSEDHQIEFMAKATVDMDGSHYNFKMTDLAWNNTSLMEINGINIRLCNPIETILLKAMLQRGADKGKHDLEDIEALLNFVTIDKNYLSKRLLECGQDERLLVVIRKYNLL